MGIQSSLRSVPSLALGTSEVIPLEIASAYAVIANGGVKVEPLAIKEVVDATGQVLERRTLDLTTVLTPQEAYILIYLLQGVVDRGTAKGVRALGFDRPVAGKTGTTSDYKDAWFLGFTPDLLSVVWVGFDQSVSVESTAPSPDLSGSAVGEIRLTGAQAALPLWTEFMKRSMAGLPVNDFIVPPRIVYRMIDPKTGLLSTSDCPETIREAFIEGTEPQESCGQTGRLPKGFFKWFKHLISTP
jgi:membrane carboxypeptidase/penicillin-binding protein